MQIFFKSKLCSFLEQCSHRQESFESLQSVSRGFKHVCLDPPRASYVWNCCMYIKYIWIHILYICVMFVDMVTLKKTFLISDVCSSIHFVVKKLFLFPSAFLYLRVVHVFWLIFLFPFFAGKQQLAIIFVFPRLFCPHLQYPIYFFLLYYTQEKRKGCKSVICSCR